MPHPSEFIPWLLIWLILAVSLVLFQWRRGHAGAGLLVAYIVGYWINHWWGAAIYALPWFETLAFRGVERTLAGFQLCTWGLAAFAAGVVVVSTWRVPQRVLAISEIVGQSLAFRRTGWMLICAGLTFLFSNQLGLGGVPSMTAVLSGGQNLTLAGLCVLCWQAMAARQHARLFTLVAATIVLLPAFTVISEGFLGYGIVATIAVLSFVAVIFRPRWAVVMFGCLGLIFATSLYVTYMSSRSEIRAAVWGGQPMAQRLDVVVDSLMDFQTFNPSDQRHLQLVDIRANQNYLVGAAVDYTPKLRPYAQGETVWLGVLALVPRVLWPEKPVSAGSMGYVSEYTGIPFAQNTSVGMGQVFEFYVNFGPEGVVIGFLLLGALLAYVDQNAARALRKGYPLQFALWFVPGLSLLQVGGAVAELTASAAGGLIAAWLIRQALAPKSLLQARPARAP